ncbi:MAG: Dcp1p-Dcp2p decapping enzyme complex alpha subunit [Chrysothrix sp. TS-e1954]|nr:MAG: Dcp1p-Dcp2p decapping enzyme complex alpha subunit [Chrysothrix sp. TS-e1954]
MAQLQQGQPSHQPVPDLASLGFFKAEPHIHRLVSSDVAGHLARGSTNFPGAQPVSFSRKHLQALRQQDYFVCEKSDGVRCLMYFDYDREECHQIHYLIDRKNDYYFVPGFHAPMPVIPPPVPAKEAAKLNLKPDWDSYHEGTLLDGELVYDVEQSGRPVLKYLVFDCLVIDGQPMMSRQLDKRIAYFVEKVFRPYQQLLKEFPEEINRAPFILEQKNFEFAYSLERVFGEILPKLKHGSDGLIFTCRPHGYISGTDEKILKWKRREENSVDFKLELEFPPLEPDSDDPDTDDEALDYDAMPNMILNVIHGSLDYRRISDSPGLEAAGLPDTMYATDEEWETMKQHAIARNDGLDGAVVECHIDSENRWRLLRFRDDKTEPNHASVVAKVIESIEDAVSEEELREAGPSIREAWKERARVEEEHEKQKRAEYERRKRAEHEQRQRAEQEQAERHKRLKLEADADQAKYVARQDAIRTKREQQRQRSRAVVDYFVADSQRRAAAALRRNPPKFKTRIAANGNKGLEELYAMEKRSAEITAIEEHRW